MKCCSSTSRRSAPSTNHRQSMTAFPRREWLRRSGAGFGSVGMLGALNASGVLASPSQGLHHAARAKRVIFLFMNGAPSHVDTFDPKPALADFEGESPETGVTQKKRAGGYMPSPFRFAPHGESGVVMSELFPNLARHADDLCVIRSMHTDVPNHEPGLLLMQSGHQQPTRPSLGSWLSYGLGTENENLPSFVAISPGLPVVGPQLWSSAFLPGRHQGMEVDTNSVEVDQLIANIRNPNLSRDEQKRQLQLLGQINQLHRQARAGETALETHIRAMELAFQMQSGRVGCLRHHQGVASDPRVVRRFGLRSKLPARSPVARARCPRRAGVLRQKGKQTALGHPSQQQRIAPHVVRRQRSRDRRVADRPQGAGLAGRHAGDLGWRIRDEPPIPRSTSRRTKRRPAAIIITPALRCGSPAAESGAG